VAGVAGDEVVGAGGVGAFEEDVVGGVGGGCDAAGRERRRITQGTQREKRGWVFDHRSPPSAEKREGWGTLKFIGPVV